jgi:hypothetical protein
MTEALHDPVERERRNLGARVLDENQAGLGRSDFRDGGGYGGRQQGAARNSKLRRRPKGRNRIDQVGVDQQRRMLEHVRSDLRLIACKRQDDGRRRLLA